MTGNKLMEEIRGDEEGGKRSAEHLSQLGTSPEDPCKGFLCSPSSSDGCGLSVFSGFNLHR